MGPRILLQPTRQLETVDAWNVQIGHHDVWWGIQCPFERLKTVMSLVDAETGAREPIGVHTSSCLVIFDEEHNGP